MTASPQIVVLGSGFAALETVFLLRKRLHEQLDITVVSEDEWFTYRPGTIYIPFGSKSDDFVSNIDRALVRREVVWLGGKVIGIEPAERMVVVAGGDRVTYDRLVVATGAAARPEEIPGLAEHAGSVWTTHSMLGVRDRFEHVRERARASQRSRVLFLVPPGNNCAGPLYELALMFDTWLHRQGVRNWVEIGLSTFEQSYFEAFGPRLHKVLLKEFNQRGIHARPHEVAAEVVPGEVHYADGSARPFDELITFPPQVAAVTYDGLPADERGFLRTESATRQVQGHPEIYAPGDAGDFPLKQSFLAFLQADAVAEHIVAEHAEHEFDQPFEPLSMCILDMLDKATYVQAPLEVTSDPDRPVRVRADADGDYKVGTSQAWRLGKKTLGTVIPLRFTTGEPFHAGLGWQVVDIGLKGMSGVLAR
jgi:sulfide:quinone oxidoreductase